MGHITNFFFRAKGLEAIEGNIGNSQMNSSGDYLVTVTYWTGEENIVAETTFRFTP